MFKIENFQFGGRKRWTMFEKKKKTSTKIVHNERRCGENSIKNISIRNINCVYTYGHVPDLRRRKIGKWSSLIVFGLSLATPFMLLQRSLFALLSNCLFVWFASLLSHDRLSQLPVAPSSNTFFDLVSIALMHWRRLWWPELFGKFLCISFASFLTCSTHWFCSTLVVLFVFLLPTVHRWFAWTFVFSCCCCFCWCCCS